MCLARGRNDSPVLDHVHYDLCRQLFRVFGDTATVPPMRVDAGPDEKNEVEQECEELANSHGEIDVVAHDISFPHGVHECILLLTRIERGLVPAAARGGIARAVLIVVGIGLGGLPSPGSIAALDIMTIARSKIAQRPIRAPAGDADSAEYGEQACGEEA